MAATFVVVFVRYCNLFIFGSVISHCGAKYKYHVGFLRFTAVIMKNYIYLDITTN
jgi:hypothetical protein